MQRYNKAGNSSRGGDGGTHDPSRISPQTHRSGNVVRGSSSTVLKYFWKLTINK